MPQLTFGSASCEESKLTSETQAKRQKQNQKPADDSDDEPISKRRSGKLPPSFKDTSVLEDSDDDEPLGTKLAQKKASIEKSAAKEAKALQAKAKKPTPKKAVKEESDDEPLSKSRKRMSNGASAAASKKRNGVKDESDSDAPIAKKAKKAAPATKAKPATKARPKATPTKKVTTPAKMDSATPKESEEPGEGEEEEEENRWWDQPKKEDNSIKWTTLEHNGIEFPPEYKPLPKDVKLYYDGKPVDLHVEAEEVAYFFGDMLHQTQHTENPVFQKNFFTDFKDIVKKTGGAKDRNGNKVEIKEFSKLDFKPMAQYLEGVKQAKKARSAAEKKAAKLEDEARKAPYMYCKWDGRKEKVQGPMVEPPGLFRGRGAHPKTGKVKKRVLPEQITINIGKEAKVPSPPPGHKWKAVQHDNKATWLAMWQENVNGNYKYIMLAANSTTKQKSDHMKFEKARKLKEHIGRIRADYQRDLKSDVMADRQRATAMYLIDKFALRAGNEKDTDNEAETVGCCSLKYEHVALKDDPPNTVVFDFLGKDSIRFYNEFVVDRQVFKNLKMFKKPPKENGDDIFDRLTVSSTARGIAAEQNTNSFI
jgi:DNA topoisomerase-1